MNTNEKSNGNAQMTSGGTPEGRTGRGAPSTPEWQKISGIDPRRENEMDGDARDGAIRKLIDEVTQRATVEFERADAGKIPEGERTIFWDPLQRICVQLGISRTKLSAYARELTGMRAYELTDRILAKRTLLGRLEAHVKSTAMRELEGLREMFATAQIDARFRTAWSNNIVRWMKTLREGAARMQFASEMGFANYSRLSRACLLALGKSLDQIEAELVCTHVQKFFKELVKTNLAGRKNTKEERAKNEPVLTEEERVAGDRIIKEVVEEVLGMTKKKEVFVA